MNVQWFKLGAGKIRRFRCKSVSCQVEDTASCYAVEDDVTQWRREKLELASIGVAYHSEEIARTRLCDVFVRPKEPENLNIALFISLFLCHQGRCIVGAELALSVLCLHKPWTLQWRLAEDEHTTNLCIAEAARPCPYLSVATEKLDAGTGLCKLWEKHGHNK